VLRVNHPHVLVDADGVEYQTAPDRPTAKETTTMNISLPEALKGYIDEQVVARGYDTRDDYVCDLIRKDLGRAALKALVLEGLASPVSERSHEDLIDGMRRRICAAS
jgi:antitoxin ParD1/3/4